MRETEGSLIDLDRRHNEAWRLIQGAGEGASAYRPPAAQPAHAPFPSVVERDRLSSTTLQESLDDAGCVLIPSLVSPEVAEELVEAVDETFAAYDRHGGKVDTGDPWYDPFVPEMNLMHATRPWLRAGGGIFTADSPRLVSRWLGLIASLGVLDIVTEIFGERPVTSLDKCALRRITAGDGIEWHQDGQFLGADSGAINLWLSLTDTDQAPGLEIVSRRFTEVVETGSHGAAYDWTVGPELVAELGTETPVIRPHFNAGDGLFFDGFLLHRTAQEPPALPRTRYAIETWFFRPSRFPPHQQVPLAF